MCIHVWFFHELFLLAQHNTGFLAFTCTASSTSKGCAFVCVFLHTCCPCSFANVFFCRVQDAQLLRPSISNESAYFCSGCCVIPWIFPTLSRLACSPAGCFLLSGMGHEDVILVPLCYPLYKGVRRCSLPSLMIVRHLHWLVLEKCLFSVSCLGVIRCDAVFLCSSCQLLRHPLLPHKMTVSRCPRMAYRMAKHFDLASTVATECMHKGLGLYGYIFSL